MFSTGVAKQTKDRLKRIDAFRNDQDGRLSDPRPYPDTETWRKAMGEKLKYKAADLRTNLEECLIAPRYDDPFRAYRNDGLTLSVLQRARRIVGAYTNGKPFSVELVTAV